MQPPAIGLKVRTHNYRYLWLKYVRGFSQRAHCYPCLLGHASALVDRSKAVGGRYPRDYEVGGELAEYRTPLVYLCGVSVRGYADNLHLAMVPDPGGTVHHEDFNVEVAVTGMRLIPIEPVPGARGNVPRAFWACRNWQAGWHFFPEARVPFVLPVGGVPRTPPVLRPPPVFRGGDVLI